ncbi:hypothetical protein BM613_13680 [Sulfoacidibacillus thermotolerans]|uniref:SHOCT domain-containing protein n=2 Tax=Sulfoacidibacillus thermotolerans TaxID=1765684 RepID=A0A2U3D0B8_SULT2|nr:hypothetical protein BM613_13680 [Sulfoacidibacillus thermotolerans]
MGYGMMGGWGGFGLIGLIFQIAALIAIVYLVMYAVRFFSGNHRSSHADDAQKILAERFARGEISAEEYRSMKEQLDSK